MKDKKTVSQGSETRVIDWGEVHRRMENTRAVIERGATPSPDDKSATLKARAKALAHDPNEKKAVGETIEVLEFLLADESYGIETSFVREVYPLKGLTPLPGTPSFVLGITSVRGQILSVIDIKKFLDLPEMKITDHQKLIIVHNESMEFGILAEHISGVQLILREEIQPPLPTLTGIRAGYLRGIANGQTAILDAEKILCDEKIVVDEA